jgi:aminocarboxymuconate-semialdehyde decarboxylase
MATASATPRVDIHAHVMISAAQDLVAPHFTLDKEPALFFASEDSRQVSGRGIAEAMCKLTTPADRIPDMERMGIDLQVLSPSPNQYYYWTEPELGLAAARLVNDGLAAMVATDRERFAGMGTVPLQDTPLAVRELERCIDALGFCGIEIGSHVAGIDLGDPRFAPFFAAAEARKVMLFLHPLGFTHGERLREYHLNNVIGNPLESTLAVSHLIFGGVLERHPELRLCVAHGGGYLPMYAGRMDHAYRARADCRRHAPRAPSEYLARLYFDSVVYDVEQLAYLIARYGSDHVLVGTDYPFDMGEPNPLELLAAVPNLDPAQRAAIAGGNALRLLGLEGTTRAG